MPAREPELPEGTDHIINGAMETGGGGGGQTESRGDGGGFVAGGDGDDTGGTAGAGDGGVRSAMRDGMTTLKQQATERARQLADDGKTRASDALDDVSRAVGEIADTVEDRLGGEYAGYARRAADAVSGLATTLREREVEELYQDAQEFVRKSPGIAITVAAVVGFGLVRLVKAGLPQEQDGQADRGGGGGITTGGGRRSGKDA